MSFLKQFREACASQQHTHNVTNKQVMNTNVYSTFKKKLTIVPNFLVLIVVKYTKVQF